MIENQLSNFDAHNSIVRIIRKCRCIAIGKCTSEQTAIQNIEDDFQFVRHKEVFWLPVKTFP